MDGPQPWDHIQRDARWFMRVVEAGCARSGLWWWRTATASSVGATLLHDRSRQARAPTRGMLAHKHLTAGFLPKEEASMRTSVRRKRRSVGADMAAGKAMPKALTLGVLLLFMTAFGAARGARATVGSFEIDGNLVDDSGPGEPIDWLSSPFPAALTTLTDTTGQGDDIFGLGSKENDQSTWHCVTGSAPDKNDVVNEISIPQSSTPVAGEVAFRFVAQQQFLYANWSRLSNNGDAHIDYEFNQLDPSTNPASASCPQLPLRRPGDFL